MQLAPWLHPTNTLESINSGSSAGLAIRAAIERERAQRAEEAMAQDRAAQAEQSAAEKLKLDYDQLGLQSRFHDQDRQARVADSQLDNETRLKLGQAANALRLTDADALSKWRSSQLDEKDKDRVLRKELAEKRSAADMLKPQHVGKSVISIDQEGNVKKIYSDEANKPTMIRNVPLLQRKSLTGGPVPTGDFEIHDPQLNQILGSTTANRFVGTNAPAIKSIEAPVAPLLPTPAASNAAEQSREKARAAIAKKPSARQEILDRLSKAGYSTEGL